MKHIIIVGAGPGGLALAMNLSQNKNRKITIIEKSKYAGGSWKSFFLENKYFCEHSPQVVFSDYDKFFQLLKILNIKKNKYTIKTDKNLIQFYLKMSRFLFKYFNFLDLIKLALVIVKKNTIGVNKTLQEVMDDYNFSKSAKKGLTMLSLAVADIPEKVLFKFISFTDSGYLLQLKDKNLFINKMINYLEKRNVNLHLNCLVTELSGKKNIKECHYIENNIRKSIKGDEFILAVPPVSLYKIIKNNKLTKNNWKPIEKFKHWAEYSSYYSIAFQLHFTEKLEWIKEWGWTINSPWYIITLPISNFITEFSRDPEIKTVWSCTIIDGNFKSPRLNKTTNECTLEEIEEEVVYQLSKEYGKKLKPKVVTFNPSVKLENGKYVSSGSGAVITKLGKLDFMGKISNLSTIGCHTVNRIANLESTLLSSMLYMEKYYPNDKLLLKANDCNKRFYYLILIILIYLFIKRTKFSFSSLKE